MLTFGQTARTWRYLHGDGLNIESDAYAKLVPSEPLGTGLYVASTDGR
jgi:hypothetical protein